jgi:hypothetical protein
LEKHLRNENLNFPDIPTERYVSRDYVFAMFVIDMMNTKNEREVRRNYSESGKQVTIETFQKYYNSLDDSEKDSFDIYVVKIMGSQAINEATANRPSHYPSIPKKIDLDGCSTGPVVNDADVVDATITNVYGYLNVRLTGNNKTGFTVIISENANPSNEILKLKPPKGFKITYDNVANFIHTQFGQNVPIRGTLTETNITDKEGPGKNLTFGPTVADKKLKILASMCLKTFCDKLYRTESGVTHICTTDSYVCADPMIEYFAGNADSIPTIMRSGDERSTDEEYDELPQDGCELGSMGISGRGFYIQPGVNSSSYIDTNYAQILKKTLGYACFLQHLFNVSECNLAAPGSPSNGERSNPIKMKNIFFEPCDGSLFSTADNTLGSLVQPIPSYRLINFVERLLANSPDSPTKLNTDSYETIIQYLFTLEYYKMVAQVKKYITTLKTIMALHLSKAQDIKASTIQLPDLEELLNMSTPAFCDENDDSLIAHKDRPLVEVSSPYWQISTREVGAEKMDTIPDEDPTFNDVIFSSKGIQITGINDVFRKMVDNQIVKEYTLSNATIRGPITLGLLCILKKLNKNQHVTNKINAEIANIITNFRKTRDLDLDYSIQKEKRARDDAIAFVDLPEPKRNKTTIPKPNGSLAPDYKGPSYSAPTISSAAKTRKKKSNTSNVMDDIENESSSNRETKRRNVGKGGSHHHNKASRKRNGRKMIHRTRKYKYN